MHPEVTPERPLTPLAKAGLIAATIGVVLVFYVFIAATIVVLAALLFFELILILAMLRFGVAGFMIRIMQAHVRVVALLPRSLWLRSDGAEFQIPLQRADAPALFDIVETLSKRFEVNPPDSIELQMNVNASVRLKGYRAGAGSTRLAVGYDLLAGLTVSEIEAVMAHEMAHAKLIQRGFKSFANGALVRCANLASALSATVDAARAAQQDCYVAAGLLKPAAALTRQLARLIAAYSRQDEFEADRGAAELCGPNALRSSLLRLDALGEASSRLSWRERVAQLQSGQSYSEWFARELASGVAAPPVLGNARLFDKYSTHPTLEDRLAALPADIEMEADTRVALSMLAAPDATAEKLVAEIQRVSALEEEKDSRALAKWKKSAASRTAVRPLQLLAIVIWIGAAITVIVGLIDGLWLLAIGAAAVFAVGNLLYRLGRYKDRVALPVPEYGVVLHARDKKFEFDRQKELEPELAQIAASEKKKKRRIERLTEEAYAALAKCDYLRAHVAARELFKVAPKSVEGHIAFSIAAAAVYQTDVAGQALRYVQSNTGFASPSSAWGGAWALILLGDWSAAEALLDVCLAKEPGNRTFLSLLALCRARRGKINGAIAKSREACTPSAPDKDHAALLIGLLLDYGLLREASARLAPLEAAAQTDPDLQILMIRQKLLTRDFAEADRWTALLKQNHATPLRLLELAQIYHGSRQFDTAGALYDETLAHGHFPAALLGQAQLQAERRNKAGARHYIMRALNLKTPLHESALGSLGIFTNLVGALNNLHEPAMCSAWTATLPPPGRYHEALANTVFLVFAADESSARQHVAEVLTAMEPEFQPTDIRWQKAASDQQPDRPVRSGIQHVTVLSAPVAKKKG